VFLKKKKKNSSAHLACCRILYSGLPFTPDSEIALLSKKAKGIDACADGCSARPASVISDELMAGEKPRSSVSQVRDVTAVGSQHPLQSNPSPVMGT
jgi:hypothetical protein